MFGRQLKVQELLGFFLKFRNIPKLNTEKVGQAAGITATGGAVVKSVLDIDGNNTISKQTKNK